ncbi:hypothetical protein SAMN05216390_102342 [Lachnospiraceae bacterium KH1T2]|nr:hypothetical protein SAMN05216390_102342 [Lachnospiraceae bacterium KH1T2]
MMGIRTFRYSVMLSGSYIENELPSLIEKYAGDKEMLEFLEEVRDKAVSRREDVMKMLAPGGKDEAWMRDNAAFSFRISVSEELAERIDELRSDEADPHNGLWGVIRRG